MKLRGLWPLTAALITVSCGTYRSGSGGYRGMGDLQMGGESAGIVQEGPPSGGSSSVYSEAELRTAQRPRGRGYVPRGDFKVFWPVSKVRINRGFRPSSDPNHEGIDLGGKRGTPIWAAHEGLVIYAGHGFSGYGKMVLLEYNGEWASLYGHLNKILVREGQILRMGDPLGEMGATGHATGVHLHFELIHHRLPVDPLRWLAKSNSYTRR